VGLLVPKRGPWSRDKAALGRQRDLRMNFLSDDPDSVVSAIEMVGAFARRKRVPLQELSLESLALITFTPFDLWEFAKKGPKTEKIRAWSGRNNRIYRGQGWIAAQSPYGAPSACMLLEELIAFGVKKVIYIGYCGSLQDEVKIGDIVVPMQTVREEGTSYHYLPEGEASLPDLRVQGQILHWMREGGLPFHQGTIWTTDAPYRETRRKISRYRREGVLAVEMEMSAVFALGVVKGISVGSILIVSDEVKETGWKVGFFSPDLKATRKNVIEGIHRRLGEMVSAECSQ
jgi:uridine phosphorylase